MKNAKCTNCGASLKVNPDNEAIICEYCKTPIITEKAINSYESTITNNAKNIVNNYYNNPQKENNQTNKIVTEIVYAPRRPKIKIGLAILGIIFYVFPGVLYIIYVMRKQFEWDNKYLK